MESNVTGRADEQGPAGPGIDPQDREFARLLLELASHARPGIIVGAVVLLAFLAYALLAPHVFTASVKLLPQGDLNQSAVFSQIEALTGASLGGDQSNELMYGKIVTSNTVLNAALEARWQGRGESAPVSLYRLLGVKEPSDPMDVNGHDGAMARKRLKEKVISFTRDPLTGYMVLSVSLVDEPAAAADLANFLAAGIEHHNRELHAARSQAHRDFIQSQLVLARDSLAQADRSLTEFLSANRRYQDSPELSQRYNELRRAEEAETQIWIELRRQLAIAAVEADRQDASLTILDAATPPVERSRPNRRMIMIFGLLAAICLGLVMTIVRYQWHILRAVRTGQAGHST